MFNLLNLYLSLIILVVDEESLFYFYTDFKI